MNKIYILALFSTLYKLFMYFCFQMLIHKYIELYFLFCKHLLLSIKTYIKNINFKKLWWENTKIP
jgi:hypothetical protein